jgi:hypothetical protein
MFTELHDRPDRDLRKLDLAERTAERRNQALAAARRDSLGIRIARTFFVLSGQREARSTARESTQAQGSA